MISSRFIHIISYDCTYNLNIIIVDPWQSINIIVQHITWYSTGDGGAPAPAWPSGDPGLGAREGARLLLGLGLGVTVLQRPEIGPESLSLFRVATSESSSSCFRFAHGPATPPAAGILCVSESLAPCDSESSATSMGVTAETWPGLGSSLDFTIDIWFRIKMISIQTIFSLRDTTLYTLYNFISFGMNACTQDCISDDTITTTVNNRFLTVGLRIAINALPWNHSVICKLSPSNLNTAEYWSTVLLKE